MKTIKFKIPLYDWDITFIEKASKKDAKKIKKLYKKVRTSKKDIKEVIHIVSKGYTNGGRFTYNLAYQRAIIIIFKPTSKKERRKVISHECRHCVDRILQHAHVDDIEAAAYLAGFISEYIY